MIPTQRLRVPIASGYKPKLTPCALNSLLSRPPSSSCRSNSPRLARIPRTRPSHPPPTSSSPPSRSRLPARPRRKLGGQPGHPAHQRELFPPEMLAAAPTDYLLDACPSCGGHLHLTDAEPIRRRPAGRHPRRAAGDPGAPRSSGVVLSLSEGSIRPAADRDRTRRPGRAEADHRDRLPQGGLSRLVLDHPQVHPRRRRLDHLAWATGARSSAR